MQSRFFAFERLFPAALTGLLVVLAGWLALSSPGRASACSFATQPTPLAVLEFSGVVVIAQVESITGEELRLQPQAYLKGPADGEPIVFDRDESMTDCDASFESGQRVLLLIPGEQASWPTMDRVFPLVDGFATWSGERIGTESDVIADLRAVTGQYAVPAGEDEEGATLDWVKVVLPVGLATLGVFAVSLVLMRMWHKIDPS